MSAERSPGAETLAERITAHDRTTFRRMREFFETAPKAAPPFRGGLTAEAALIALRALDVALASPPASPSAGAPDVEPEGMLPNTPNKAGRARDAVSKLPSGFHDGVLYCYGGCGRSYGDFPDTSLPTALWNRIAVGAPFDEAQTNIEREGRGGVLCPACVAARLAELPECQGAIFVDLVDRRSPSPGALAELLKGMVSDRDGRLTWAFTHGIEVQSSGGTEAMRWNRLFRQVSYVVDDLARKLEVAEAALAEAHQETEPTAQRETNPTSDKPRAQKGDWIRFQHGGVLVISIVEYVKPERYGTGWEYTTPAGTTSDDAIFEVRRKAAP